MVTIKATFKGEDGSMGYKHGKEYELIFWTGGLKIWIKRAHLSDNPHGYGKTPYDSLKAFLKNWKID